MSERRDIGHILRQRFGAEEIAVEPTADGLPTVWMPASLVIEALGYLKREIPQPYRVLYDVTAVDERDRRRDPALPPGDFTVIYHLLSYERNADLRIKVPVEEAALRLPTATGVWSSANWYEREVWDMFGISFDGHPDLRRILLPPTWEGHPLRKDYPARATETGPYMLPDEKLAAEQAALKIDPEAWGLARGGEDADYMFLNLGPQHPGTHGVLRIALQLDGEDIVGAVPDIGYHHRGAEKMAERQTWHTYIPYTDRIDYLSGVLNNFGYVLAVERLAGITVPERAEVIRIMMAEIFRIANHLVWYGTFAQDLGALSPVFYTFADRERILDVVAAITGGRMHPSWFRIGGVMQDLPSGWQEMIRGILDYLPKRLAEYDKIVMRNSIFKARTEGVGAYSLDEAIEWGVTGPNLRSCGFEWDFRKERPYGGYERFAFDVPTAEHGDCYDRAVVRIEEMRQSLRIIRQCLECMPDGPYKSAHPLATPPLKPKTMKDIETLITHFLSVSWGPVIPAGEVFQGIESSKGSMGYYLVSDGGATAYRARVRTPSFAHMQTVPMLSRGLMVADLLAILGSIDFVLADVDR